ncbi:MAG: glycine cleavage system aminomethyltransferase GcvT [Melioribacteraceae bacterium]|nr:glycine cleavage system aminomethyltransferase GcvT [Melioribacteraceae bacterium]
MKETKFYNCHIKQNAKMVDFAGFTMPIQYNSIIAEHKAVRETVGVFDVSHMGEIIIRGDAALDFVQKITVNNAANLEIGKVQYSAMCYENGGIVDDLLVYKINEKEYLLVVNGSNKDKDYEWMIKNNSFGVDIIDESEEYSLLAVQGPNSQKLVEKLFNQKIDIEFYSFINATFLDTQVIVSRTGYTGELGYELYFKGSEEIAEMFWDKLFDTGKEFGIVPTGLGCRDSLRLEMGYCLYGNDIDQTTTPLEAGLGWITKLKKGEFIGSDVLIKQKEEGIKNKLVPLIFDERAFPRKDYEIAKDGKIIGRVTSGTVSPIIEKPIAMGYIKTEFAKVDEMVDIMIRDKAVPARITKLPFVSK